jgi:hypothetical protein
VKRRWWDIFDDENSMRVINLPENQMTHDPWPSVPQISGTDSGVIGS